MYRTRATHALMSHVPWMPSTGTLLLLLAFRASHTRSAAARPGAYSTTPAIDATSRTRSNASHARISLIIAPLEKPALYTRAASMHAVADRFATTARASATSSTPSVFAGAQHTPALKDCPTPHISTATKPRASAAAHHPQLPSAQGSGDRKWQLSVQPCQKRTSGAGAVALSVAGT